MRAVALQIFNEALESVDSYEAVRRSVRLNNSGLKIVDRIFERTRRIYAIAVGKAALPMAAALDDVLGDKLAGGFVSGPVVAKRSYDALNVSLEKLSARWRWRNGGHPLPNEDSLIAAREAFDLLHLANEKGALIIFLISGGGSAMIEWPRDERITLMDLRTANRALVSCGASIAEVNAVRRAFSAVKGGALSLHAPNADQVTLIISDTNTGDEANVASGPTIPPHALSPDPREVITRYGLKSHLPPSILRAIDEHEIIQVETPVAARDFFVLLNNESALEAAATAARARGFVVEIARDLVEQPIEEGCAGLIARLSELKRRNDGETVCLISGGEFACPVKGEGLGGRNSETALRLAIEISGLKERGEASQVVALSAGTDGIDGNSPAAGAIADHETVLRARALNLSAENFLAASDSFSLFQKLGDEITTGATGTNVRDLRVLLAV